MAAQGPLGMQPQQEITPQVIQQGILGMKKQLSQIEGECNTMRGDAQSSIFNNIASICGRMIQHEETLKRQLQEKTALIEKIYQAHPEIKIATEADNKKQKAQAEKGKAKLVEKKS